MTSVTTTETSDGKGPRAAVVLAWVGLGLAVGCGIAALLAGPGYRLGWWRLGPGFQIVRWSVIIDLAAIVIAIAASILAYKYGARRALVAVVGSHRKPRGGGPARLPLAAGGRLAAHSRHQHRHRQPAAVRRGRPIAQGRQESNRLQRRDGSAAKQGYPDIGPALLNVPPPQALQLAERAARAIGWDIAPSRPTTCGSKRPIPRCCSASRTTSSFA